MIKPLNDFARRFGTQITLDENSIAKKQGRYFLLNENVKRLTSKGFYYAGTYLGKVKDGKFFPSFNLLNMVAQKKARSITIGKQAEWLFICGRDVFEQGITKVTGSTKKGDYTLVLNSCGECLGFGKILRNLNRKRKGPAVENILDIGDFLRRER
jgi:ribosome biogenesis protein Nip4